MNRRMVTLTQYKSRFLALVKHPFFWILTVLGNSIIFFGSLLIYFVECGSQKSLQFIDCLLWATGLVTTIGYGDFNPQTLAGKFVILALMMSGTLFVWSYMGFLVTGLIAPELTSLEQDVHDVEKEIKTLKEENKKTV